MITATSINSKGETGEKIKLTDELWSTKANPSLLAQNVRTYLSNQRLAHAKTKTRGEVEKTTAKMYRQKGTGRARHGSYSAPIFVGGGIAFGPKGNQNYKLKMSKQQTSLAIKGALNEKATGQNLVILTGNLKNIGKTKDTGAIMKNFKDVKGRLLVIVAAKETGLARAFRNMENAAVIRPNQLNTYQILKHQKLLMTEAALEETGKIL